jgi:15-cis-phytoene synthase
LRFGYTKNGICPIQLKLIGKNIMTVSNFSWENDLYHLAQLDIELIGVPSIQPGQSRASLDAAYLHCQAITRTYSRTFYMASSLLPAPKQKAAWALYAFCRTTDDIVDLNAGNPAQELETWRQSVLLSSQKPTDPVLQAWNDTRTTFRIPTIYVRQLLDGVGADLTITRYQTFKELVRYCYGVASTVGLMTMHIIGFEGEEATRCAIRLGVALQLTNILRDIGEDYRKGRIYLPQDELENFGIHEEQIQAGIVDDHWRNFMHFQIERTRQLYAASLPGIRMLHSDGRFAITAAAELYRLILDDIIRHDYDVFTQRASASQWNKVRHLPGIWWRANTQNQKTG